MNLAKQTAPCAIAIVANDKVLDWLLPFLESYRDTNAEFPLHLIPFDDNVSRTRRAALLAKQATVGRQRCGSI